jgi:hypothetical protein
MISNETNPLFALGVGVPFIAAFRFTTNGAGVPTLTQSHKGLISIVQATNTYTITFPKSWATTDAVLVSHSLEATVSHVETNSPSARTVTLVFGATLASATVSVMLAGRTSV